MEARAMEVVGQARGFGDLPAEVTLHIMQFLPPKDLGRCVMVNTKCNINCYHFELCELIDDLLNIFFIIKIIILLMDLSCNLFASLVIY
jgi:hypothetical protein